LAAQSGCAATDLTPVGAIVFRSSVRSLALVGAISLAQPVLVHQHRRRSRIAPTEILIAPTAKWDRTDDRKEG
jgi:hypothetical protein